jgi:hypothetical protein
MKRISLSPKELHDLLEREFARRQLPRCQGRCRIAQPYWRAPPKDGCSNWQIPPAAWCPWACDWIMREVRNRLKKEYDLVDAGR